MVYYGLVWYVEYDIILNGMVNILWYGLAWYGILLNGVVFSYDKCNSVLRLLHYLSLRFTNYPQVSISTKFPSLSGPVDFPLSVASGQTSMH